MDNSSNNLKTNYLINAGKYVEAINKVKNSLSGKRLEMGDSEIEYGLENSLFTYNESTRGLSWQIPKLDEWTRNRDYLINASTWRANNIVKRGIDLNLHDKVKVTTRVAEEIQNILVEDLYNPLFSLFYLGYFHGGSGALIIINGQTDKEEMLKPLNPKTVKKGDFLGLKPLTRLYNIQPCYETQYINGEKQSVFINEIGESVGIYDATEFGKPQFYRVSLNADLYGDGDLTKRQINKATSYIVHRSHLLIYNSSPLSHIEERIEQFFGTSIGEKAYQPIIRYENLIDQISMLMERANVPVLKSPSLTKASMQGGQFQQDAAERIDGTEMSIAYGNMVVLMEDEEFDFKMGQFQHIPELLTEYKKNLSSALGCPSSRLFNEYEANDEKAFDYLVEADCERHLRSMYRQLIPIISRSSFEENIEEFSFTFKSLETQTEKEKAEVLKLAIEIISIAWKDEVINESSYHKMLLSATHNISDMLSELDEAYTKHIVDKEQKEEFITYSTKRIELAIALNRQQAYNEVGSAEGGKREGGSPKRTKKPKIDLPITEKEN